MPKLRILIDECLDRRLVKEIHHAYVKTVPDMGWAGLTNGKLLTQAQMHFDAFVTSDQNLSFQQNLDKYKISIFVLCPPRNQIEDLKSLIPALLKALNKPLTNRPTFIR